jgi:hypothetical protein
LTCLLVLRGVLPSTNPLPRGAPLFLAVDRDQARVCLDYVKSFFEQPMLKRMVNRITADSIELTNELAIEIFANDKRRVRGRTVICAIFDGGPLAA